jgi:hypothetical protein
MIGRKDRSKRSLFIAGDIEQFIPDAHILKRVDLILDENWGQPLICCRARSCYSEGVNPAPEFEGSRGVKSEIWGQYRLEAGQCH